MKKRLMILGAGVYQVPAILKAKEMGYETIVLSYNIKSYPGYNLADIPIEVDTTNQGKALEIAKQYCISGVFTTGTDVALKTLGYINSSLGLNGPSYEACLLSTDKSRMKKTFIENNVPTAQFFSVFNYIDAQASAQKIGYPVMVKAINNSGSRGISKAESQDEFQTAWEYAKKYSKPGDPVIIKEFLDGVEFGVQAFIYQEKIQLVTPHNDTTTPPPYSTPIGHSYPFKEPSIHRETEKAVIKGIKALGINNSAVNIDLIKTSKDVKILEIGARMGATCLPELTHIYTGIDVLKECIKISIGEKPAFTKTQAQPVAGLLIGSKISGQIEAIKIPKEVDNQAVAYFSLDIHEGDEVKQFKIGPDRIGEIIVTGTDYSSAEKTAKDITDRLTIKVSEKLAAKIGS